MTTLQSRGLLVFLTLLLAACGASREVSSKVVSPSELMTRAILSCELDNTYDVRAYAIVAAGRFSMIASADSESASIDLRLKAGDEVQVEMELVENGESTVFARASATVPEEGGLNFTENQFEIDCPTREGSNAGTVQMETDAPIDSTEDEADPLLMGESNGSDTESPETDQSGSVTTGDGPILDTQSGGLFTTDDWTFSLQLAEVVDPGLWLRMEVSVGNTSNADLTDLRINYRVPEGLFHNRTADAIPNFGGCTNCSNGDESFWAIDRLSPGSTRTFEMITGLSSELVDGATIPIRFTLTGGQIQTPTEVERTITIIRTPLVETTIASLDDPVQPGQTTQVEVNVGNISSGELQGLGLQVKMPTGVMAQAIESNGLFDAANNTVTWDLAAVPVLSGINRRFDLVVGANVEPGSVIPLQSYVYDKETLAILRTSEHLVTVSANEPPLILTVSTTSHQVAAGGVVPLVISITNQGLVPATNVSFSYRVPNGLSHNRTSDATPNTGGCTNCGSGDESSISYGAIPAGGTFTSIISAQVASGLQAGSLVEPYFILSYDQQSDTVIRSPTVIVDNNIDALVRVSSSVDAIQPGDSFSIQYTVGNTGNQPLSGSSLHASIPIGTALNSSSNDGVSNGSEITWALGTLSPLESLTRSAEFTLNNSVESGVKTFEAVTRIEASDLPLNRSDFGISHIAEPVGVDFNVTAEPTAQPGSRYRYLISITNQGFVPLNDLTLTHRLADYVSYNRTFDAEPDSSGCTNCGPYDESFWSIPTIEPSATYQIEVNANINSQAPPGFLINAQFLLTGTENDTLFKVLTTPVAR